ncbi:hypothetical protein OAL13_00185 [bacterium]|nr:hypothetical protein [bacterium]
MSRNKTATQTHPGTNWMVEATKHDLANERNISPELFTVGPLLTSRMIALFGDKALGGGVAQGSWNAVEKIMNRVLEAFDSAYFAESIACWWGPMETMVAPRSIQPAIALYIDTLIFEAIAAGRWDGMLQSAANRRSGKA